MQKKIWFILQFCFFILFNFFLLMAGYQLLEGSQDSTANNRINPNNISKEEFDSSLGRLNSMDKLKDYVDSNFQSELLVSRDRQYSELASRIVRLRFRHGYSLYNYTNNFTAPALAKLIGIEGLQAIVEPDDILKYPNAACSQQSIVMMELLRQNGINTRKVGFTSKITGHFCFEAFYDNGWHYFDPDKEPRQDILNSYNRPSIAWLNAHPAVLQAAYPQYSKEFVMEVFTNYQYGPENSFPAPKALLFQRLSKFLSYSIWSFFLLAFIWARKNYKKSKRLNKAGSHRRVYNPQALSWAPASIWGTPAS